MCWQIRTLQPVQGERRPQVLKNAAVLLIPFLLLGSSAVVMGQLPVNQSEDAGPLADGDIEEQIRELLERIRDDASPLLRFVLPLLPFVLVGVLLLFRAFTFIVAGRTEVRGARKELSDPDSELSQSLAEAPAEEFKKSRQTRRLERTISDEQGTRGVPLG